MTSNRLSSMSGASTPTGVRLSATTQQSTQVSTTTLLNALHTTYTSGQPYRLDASTTLVVNTWLTALNPNIQGQLGGTVDTEIVRQAWEHCRRRAEDGCILLGLVRQSPDFNACTNANIRNSDPYMHQPLLFYSLQSLHCH